MDLMLHIVFTFWCLVLYLTGAKASGVISRSSEEILSTSSISHTSSSSLLPIPPDICLSDPRCHRNKRLLTELRKRRTLEVLRLDVKTRKKRYNYGDYHDWDEDPGNYDYDDPKTSMSYIDKIQKHGSSILMLTAIVIGILMCCFVTFILPCLRFCGECCRCCKTNCLMCYDCIVCRDPKYRILQSIGERTGMQMPDYNSYIMMRDVYSQAAKECAQESAESGAFF